MAFFRSKNIKEQPGVYVIWNITKDKVYVGSSTNVKNRIICHETLLRNNKSRIAALQQDYNSGDRIIAFVICKAYNETDLTFYEKIAAQELNALESGYNTRDIYANNENTPVSKIKSFRFDRELYYCKEKEEKRNIIENLKCGLDSSGNPYCVESETYIFFERSGNASTNGIKYKIKKLSTERGENRIKLKEAGISEYIISQILRNKPVPMSAIGKICYALNCQPGDILEWKPDTDTTRRQTHDKPPGPPEK